MNVDCSILEGGGQIIRNCLALSAITRQPVRLTSIRNNRPVPGLSNQHLEVARVVRELAGGSLRGAEIRSTDLEYTPGDGGLTCRSLERNIGSAGAIPLVVQAVLPYLVGKDILNDATRSDSTECEIKFVGGTNVPFSPPADHLELVLLPLLRKMRVRASTVINKRGFYPAGGGNMTLVASPSDLTPLELSSRGEITAVEGVIFGTGPYCTKELGKEFQRSLRRELEEFFSTRNMTSAAVHLRDNRPLRVDVPESGSPGGGGNRRGGTKPRTQHSSLGAQVCMLYSNGASISANVLFEGKGADFFSVEGAVLQIMAQLAWTVDSGACVDEHTADQLIIFMALCAVQNPGEAGRSQILVAPKAEHPLTYEPLGRGVGPTATAAVGSPPVRTGGALASSDPVTAPAVFRSSLHLETAIHAVQLFLGCTVTIEEVGPNRCRLVTCAMDAPSGECA